MLDTPAWKDLSAIERAVYLDLSYYYNGSNNGCIGYSTRTAQANLKIGKSTAARALLSLQAHGFIVVEKIGAFHCKIHHASEYRLTIYPSDTATSYAEILASKEFARWPEIQNSVPVAGPTVPVAGPGCTRSGTRSSKKGDNGTCSGTVEAKYGT